MDAESEKAEKSTEVGAVDELNRRIRSGQADFSPDIRAKIVDFYRLLAEENSRQNLTRLITPTEFYDGHLLDVCALFRSGLVRFPAMDLGSGGGVPGLLAACIRPDLWILVDSESRKAEFLSRAADMLRLSNVRVMAGRAERALGDVRVESIVARAVGTVEKIYGWIRPCSTWNNLILLKGPGWNTEWESFLRTKYRRELKVGGIYEYHVGPEKKYRVIVRLDRVPRGT